MRRTKGQAEDALAKEFTRYYLKKMGTGPKESRVYIVADMVIVRLKGELLPFEEILLKSKHGIELVKQIRKNVYETIIGELGMIIEKETKCKVTSFHSDSSTKTGERFEIFILDSNLEATFTI